VPHPTSRRTLDTHLTQHPNLLVVIRQAGLPPRVERRTFIERRSDYFFYGPETALKQLRVTPDAWDVVFHPAGFTVTQRSTADPAANCWQFVYQPTEAAVDQPIPEALVAALTSDDPLVALQTLAGCDRPEALFATLLAGPVGVVVEDLVAAEPGP